MIKAERYRRLRNACIGAALASVILCAGAALVAVVLFVRFPVALIFIGAIWIFAVAVSVAVYYYQEGANE